MFSIIKAAIIGGIASVLTIYGVFSHTGEITKNLSEFKDEESVRLVLERNVSGSGFYLIPKVEKKPMKEGAFDFFKKTNGDDKTPAPTITPLTPDALNPSEIDPSIQEIEETTKPKLLVVMAVQEEGSPIDSYQKLVVLLGIQIFAAFMIATLTSLSKVSNYFFHVLMNTFGGAMQVLTTGLFLVFYLGFPFELLFIVSETVILSWFVAALLMAIWTRRPKRGAI
jgi:hypothetical protein